MLARRIFCRYSLLYKQSAQAPRRASAGQNPESFPGGEKGRSRCAEPQRGDDNSFPGGATDALKRPASAGRRSPPGGARASFTPSHSEGRTRGNRPSPPRRGESPSGGERGRPTASRSPRRGGRGRREGERRRAERKGAVSAFMS